MKQFLYLDVDIVTSIVAQKEKGLVIQQVNEKNSATEELAGTEKYVNGKMDSATGFLGFAKWGFGLNGGITKESSISTQVTAREMVEKTMHDAAFDIAYAYLDPKKIDTVEEIEDDSRYIAIRKKFDYLDFEYLESLFNDDGLIDFIKQTEAEAIKERLKIEKEQQGINREAQRANKISYKEIEKNQIDDNNKNYDNILKIIKILRNVLPYKRILFSNDGIVIPLEDDFFRVNPSSLGLRYGGDISCTGIITNIINSGQDGEDDNNFAAILSSVNSVIKELLSISTEKLYIVHPIGIYYENQKTNSD